MTYRVSTNKTGITRWWLDHHEIPATETGLRQSTPDETAVMDKIANAKGMPSLALGERVNSMLNPST